MTNDSLSKWTAAAEIIAAVGVILSLVFVGLQIEDGNRETRAATLQAAADSEMFMQSQLLRYADVWEKINSGQPLTEGTEKRTGILLYKMAMTEYENRLNQYEAGYVDQEKWETRIAGLRKFVALPFFDIWRPTLGAIGSDPTFLELVDEIRAAQD
jgi:hypothetical protein